MDVDVIFVTDIYVNVMVLTCMYVLYVNTFLSICPSRSWNISTKPTAAPGSTLWIPSCLKQVRHGHVNYDFTFSEI